MKRSARFAALMACVLLGACSALPFGQTATQTRPKPKPSPVAQPAQSTPIVAPTTETPTTVQTTPTNVDVTASTVVAPSAVARGDADARFKMALDLLKQNQPQEAEAALTELSKDFPQFGGPFTDLGILYAKSKRVQPAIAAFTRAAAMNPQNATAYNWLGILLRESKDYVRAEQAYQKALAINPNHAGANLNLGVLYDAYLGRSKEALPYYRNYQRLGGQEDLRVLVWIAQIEKQQPNGPSPAATPNSQTKTPAAAPGIATPQEKRP